VILSCDIHQGFVNNSPTIAAFLDIKSAFDNVIPNILMQDLENIGIPAKSRKFILNLISARMLHFVYDGNKIGPFYSYKGVPQGSTLSPLLFDIYLKDIVKYLHPNSKILLYADDITIYSTSNNPIEAFYSLQNSLDSVSNFLRSKGLDLSPEKSRCIIFTKSKTSPILPSIKINGTSVPFTSSVKFLGIVLDSKMLGKAHLKYLICKGSIIVDILASLAGTWWGSHPHLLLSLYRSIFRGSIEYGCHIFKFNLNKTIFTKLERLQYRAIRIALGYRISTPINVMLFESREIPLKIRFVFLMRKYIIKSLARKFNPVIESLELLKISSSHRVTCINLLQSLPIFKQYVLMQHYRYTIHCTPFLPYFFFDLNTSLVEINPCMSMFPIDKNLSNPAINKIFLEKSSLYSSNASAFYTDGSKVEKDTPTGASVYSPNFNLNIMHRLPMETSIFSAEAWAILTAINAIFDLRCDKAVIFTDSKSVLDALASPLSHNKNYLIHYIRNSWLRCIHNGTELYLFWIPSHKGIRGNEIADFLAKKATTQGYKPDFKIPYSDLHAEIKESLDKSFSAYLSDAARTKGTLHSSLYQSLISKHPWYYGRPLNRKEIVLVNRIRSNHYNLNYSLHRKNMTTSAACPCGDSRQDINHIIFYCPNTIMKSGRLRNYLRQKYPNHNIDILPILRDPDPKLIRLLLSYFNSINILI